jgi:hypothetical protein
MKLRLAHLPHRKRQRPTTTSTDTDGSQLSLPESTSTLSSGVKIWQQEPEPAPLLAPLPVPVPVPAPEQEPEPKQTAPEVPHFITPSGNPYFANPPSGTVFSTVNPVLLQRPQTDDYYQSTPLIPGAVYMNSKHCWDQHHLHEASALQRSLDESSRGSNTSLSPVFADVKYTSLSSDDNDEDLPHKKYSSWRLRKPSLEDLKAKSQSLRSLMARLANAYPASYMDHVRSVLSVSSSQTDSWRSSMKSAGSMLSDGSSILARAGVVKDKSSESVLDAKNSSLSKGEQLVWNELVNESSVADTQAARPAYLSVSLSSRPCCSFAIEVFERESFSMFDQPNDILCSHCGFLRAHNLARTYQAVNDDMLVLRELLQGGSLSAEDNYGNTPLHFMAASETVKLEGLISLIHAGANVHARNSSGQTFLHCIKRRDSPLDFEPSVCFSYN